MILNVMDSGVFDLTNVTDIFFPHLMLSFASFGICLFAKALVYRQVRITSEMFLPLDSINL